MFGEWVSEWWGVSYLGSVYLLQRKQRKEVKRLQKPQHLDCLWEKDLSQGRQFPVGNFLCYLKLEGQTEEGSGTQGRMPFIKQSNSAGCLQSLRGTYLGSSLRLAPFCW